MKKNSLFLPILFVIVLMTSCRKNIEIKNEAASLPAKVESVLKENATNTVTSNVMIPLTRMYLCQQSLYQN